MKRNSAYGGPQSQGQYGSRSPQQIRPNALQIPVSYQEEFWHGIHRNQTALPFPPAGQGLIRNQPDLQHPLHHSRILERNTASAGYNNSAQPSSSYLLRQGSYIEQPLDGRYRLDMALKRRRLDFAGAQLFPRQVLDPTTIQMGGGGTARYDTDESYRNQMYERPTVAPLGVMAPSRWSNSHCYPRNTGDFRMHSHANYEKRLGGGYSESATNTQQQPVVLHRQDFPHRAASQQLRPLPTAALQNTINPYGFQRSNIAVEAKATRIGSDNKAGMSAPPESLFHYRQYPGTLKTQIQSGKEVSRSLSKPSTTESLPFCCKYCNKRRNLFYCDTCGRGFSDRGTLESHSRIHTGEKPFQCPQCKRRFTQKGNLNRHLKLHRNPGSKLKERLSIIVTSPSSNLASLTQEDALPEIETKDQSLDLNMLSVVPKNSSSSSVRSCSSFSSALSYSSSHSTLPHSPAAAEEGEAMSVQGVSAEEGETSSRCPTPTSKGSCIEEATGVASSKEPTTVVDAPHLLGVPRK